MCRCAVIHPGTSAVFVIGYLHCTRFSLRTPSRVSECVCSWFTLNHLCFERSERLKWKSRHTGHQTTTIHAFDTVVHLYKWIQTPWVRMWTQSVYRRWSQRWTLPINHNPNQRLHRPLRSHHRRQPPRCNRCHWPHRSMKKAKNSKSHWTIRPIRIIQAKQYTAPFRWIANKRRKYAVSNETILGIDVFLWLFVLVYGCECGDYRAKSVYDLKESRALLWEIFSSLCRRFDEKKMNLGTFCRSKYRFFSFSQLLRLIMMAKIGFDIRSFVYSFKANNCFIAHFDWICYRCFFPQQWQTESKNLTKTRLL